VSVLGRALQGVGSRDGQGLRGKGGRRGMARTGRLQSGGRTDAATPSLFATDMRDGSFVLGYGGGGRGNLPQSSSRLPSKEGYFQS
jgi:hypothetical protein